MPPKFGSDDFSEYEGYEEPQEGDTGDERIGPGLNWKPQYVEKLAEKHGVETHEVQEVFLNSPYIVPRGRGHVLGEDKFVALGKTDGGRLLLVVYLQQAEGLLIISARDMMPKERRLFEAKRPSS